MSFALLLQFQFLCALPFGFLRDVLFLGLPAFAQRRNAVPECFPVDPRRRGPQPRCQIIRGLSLRAYSLILLEALLSGFPSLPQPRGKVGFLLVTVPARCKCQIGLRG